MAVNNIPSIFHIDCISPLLELISKELDYSTKEMHLFFPSVRAVIDSIRSATFICSEGIKPDNSSRGRILKRLIKNYNTQLKYLNLNGSGCLKDIILKIIDIHHEYYPKIKENRLAILNIMLNNKFE